MREMASTPTLTSNASASITQTAPRAAIMRSLPLVHVARPSVPLLSLPITGVRAVHSERPSFDPAWLRDLRHRKTKHFQEKHISRDHISKLHGLMRTTDRQWIELLAGREGFGTSKRWRGLSRHRVAWGDMVSALPRNFTELHRLSSNIWPS